MRRTTTPRSSSIPTAYASKVRDFEAYAVGIDEERGVVVRRIFRIVARLRHVDTGGAELRRGAIDHRLVHHAETEVMETRRVGIMIGRPGSSGAQREAELPIVVVNVWVAGDRRGDLAVAENGQCAVVEGFRAKQIAHRDVDVIDADDFDGHGLTTLPVEVGSARGGCIRRNPASPRARRAPRTAYGRPARRARARSAATKAMSRARARCMEP